jgi:hypothetical protein
MALVRQRTKGELDGFVLRAKGDADHVLRRWFGEIDLRKRLGF